MAAATKPRGVALRTSSSIAASSSSLTVPTSLATAGDKPAAARLWLRCRRQRVSRDCGRSSGGGGDASAAGWRTVAADAGRDEGRRGASALSDSRRTSRRTDVADFSSSELERRVSAAVAGAAGAGAGAPAMPASISTTLEAVGCGRGEEVSE